VIRIAPIRILRHDTPQLFGPLMTYPFDRSEVREQAVVAVMLASVDGRLSTECVFTENVSGHGARVIAKQRWRIDDALVIKSLEGDFQAEGRVVYSESLGKNATAVGLKLLRPTGQWTRAVRALNSRVQRSIYLKRRPA
jgi:hypothetical protein